MNPAQRLLAILQKDSKVLFEIAEDFVYRAQKLQLISFFEMFETRFGLFKRMVRRASRP